MERLPEFIINNWLLFAALVGVTGLLVGDTIVRSMRGIKNVSPQHATQLINHENAVVIDVREESEFQDGHILNSLHIPLKSLESRLNELDKYKSTPLILSCRSGNRSSTAGTTLRKNGFEKIYCMGGGIMAWKNANLPLSKTA